MIIQDILTYITIISAIIFTAYKTVYFFIPPKNDAPACGGGCSACEIKNEILEKNRLKNLTLKK